MLSDVTQYVLMRLAARNYLLHRLRRSELVLKQQVLPSVTFHHCSVWEQHRPQRAVECISCLRFMANGVDRYSDLHDQSNDFHSKDSNILSDLDRDEVQSQYVAVTCLIWPGEECLSKWGADRSIENTGRRMLLLLLLLYIPQEQMVQLAGRQ